MGTTGHRIQECGLGNILGQVEESLKIPSKRTALMGMIAKKIIWTEKHPNIMVKSTRFGASLPKAKSPDSLTAMTCNKKEQTSDKHNVTDES